MATFTIDCEGNLFTLEITEVGGNLEFKVSVPEGFADIRGLFFDFVGDVGTLTNLQITGSDITEVQVGEGAIHDLGNGANLNGSDSKTGEPLGLFDVGVEIGTQGIAVDDIFMTTFVVDADQDLTIDDIDVEHLGLRLMSVLEEQLDPDTGEPTGVFARTGSLKLIFNEEPPNEPPGIEDAKEFVFEAALPNGTDPDSTAETVSGMMTITDDVGAEVVSVSFKGNPPVLIPSGGSNTISGDFGTLTMYSDGTYSYTLTSNSLDHDVVGEGAGGETTGDEPGEADGNIEDLFLVTVSDGEFTANANLEICIHDDAPLADIQRTNDMVMADETVGTPDPDSADGAQVGNDEGAFGVTISATATTLIGRDTADLIDTVGSNPGADGGTTVVTFNILALDSGLKTTDGHTINLVAGATNQEVIGRDAVTGDDIFALKIDNDGNVLLEQYDSLEHGNTLSNDEIAFLGIGKLEAVVKVTDGEGDYATDSIDLGGTDAASSAVKFDDDGPTADVQPTDEMAVTDETVGTPDPDGPGMAAGNDETGAGAALIAGETAIGFAQANLIDSSGSDVGEDDEGAPGTSTSLALNSTYVLGTAIGIQTTAGEDIELVDNGGVIEGRVIGTGQAVFAIAISGDQVTVEQYESLDHPDDMDDDDILPLGSGLVDAVVTTEDGDGDTDEVRIDVGANIKFEDDGPTASVTLRTNMAVTDESVGLPDPDGPGMQVGNDEDSAGAPLVVGQTAIGFAQANLINTSGSDEGEDDEGAPGVSTSLALSASYTPGTAIGIQTTAGDDIKLVKEGDIIVGRTIVGNQAVFAIAISGELVTVEQYESLDHLPSLTADDIMALGAGLVDAVVTVEDGDGDTDDDRVDIGANIKFEDDGPTLGAIGDGDDPFAFTLNNMEMKTFSFDVGEDDEGAPGLALVDYTDPDNMADLAASGLDDLEALLGDITASQVGNVVTYYTNGTDELFRLTLSDEGGGTGKWAFEVLQEAPFVSLALDLGALKPGSPTEDEILTGQTGSGKSVKFDGLNWRSLTIDDALLNPAANLGTGNTLDDINTNQQGFGIKDGQASQVNNLEGFFAEFGDRGGPQDDEVVGFFFDIEGIGNIKSITINYLVADDTNNDGIIQAGEIVAQGSRNFTLPTGNNEVQFLITADPDTPDNAKNIVNIGLGGEFDFVYIQAQTPDGLAKPNDPGSWNDGVRFNDFGTIERSAVPPVQLEFSAQVTDGDTDATQVEDWFVFVG